MKMEIEVRYCVKRGGNLYYQRAIPTKLQDVVGKRLVKVPLKSVSPAAVRKEIEQLNRFYEREWADLRAGLDGPSVVAKARLMLKEEAWNVPGDTANEREEHIHNAIWTMATDGDKVAETALRMYDAGKAPFLSEAYAHWEKWRGDTINSGAIASTKRALEQFIAVVGDKPISEITRGDVNQFVDNELAIRGLTSGSVKRALSVLKSVFNRARTRTGMDIVNPFERYELPKVSDANPRIAFTIAEVDEIKKQLLAKEKLSTVESILAIQMCTGATVSEVVGAALEDVVLTGTNIPHLDITPRPWRKLKNDSARPRKVPLIGLALIGAERLVELAKEIGSDQYLCSQYFKEGEMKATHASNAINKRLKAMGFKKTSHSLRHYIVSELTNLGAPLDIRYSISGHSLGTEGQRTYDRGDIPLELKLEWLQKLA